MSAASYNTLVSLSFASDNIYLGGKISSTNKHKQYTDRVTFVVSHSKSSILTKICLCKIKKKL